MSDEMTNDDLRRRLVQGLPLCPHEHTAHNEVRGDGYRYWLTCDDEILGEVSLGVQEEPTGFFDRWGRQHQYEVARRHLERLLDPPEQGQGGRGRVPPQIKPGGLLEDLLIIGQTTNETLKRIQSIMDMQKDRIAVLEAAVEEQGEMIRRLPVGGGWDR